MPKAIGAGEEIRTLDILVGNEMLYHWATAIIPLYSTAITTIEYYEKGVKMLIFCLPFCILLFINS